MIELWRLDEPATLAAGLLARRREVLRRLVAIERFVELGPGIVVAELLRGL